MTTFTMYKMTMTLRIYKVDDIWLSILTHQTVVMPGDLGVMIIFYRQTLLECRQKCVEMEAVVSGGGDGDGKVWRWRI
jgi:hypothetical protein